MRAAIIGTREPGIPLEELIPLFKVHIPEDAIITSGNAVGVDQVSKAWKKNLQYLPWFSYNQKLGFGYRHCVAGGIKIYDAEIAKLWVYLAAASKGVLAMVRRNCCIILGRDGQNPVDVVYYYASEKDGAVQGGTKYGVEFARAHGIPTYNLKKG